MHRRHRDEKGPEAPQSVATPRCLSLQRRILVLLVIAAHMGLHLPLQAQVEPYRMQFPISRGALIPVAPRACAHAERGS